MSNQSARLLRGDGGAAPATPAAPLVARILMLPLGLAAGSALATPIGGAHDWTGAVSDSWHISGNWNTGQVPGAGDAAIVMGGPFNNVFLGADSADLGSLFIANAKSVSNQGHALRVTDGAGTTTVSGLDSSVFVVPVGDGGYGFRTNELEVQSNGRLIMAGGDVRIDDQLTLLSGARVVGRGTIDVVSPAAAAFNGAAGGALTVTGGDLRIAVSGGGSMVLPAQIDVLQAGRTLELAGPMHLPVQDVNLGPESTIDMVNPWTIAGDLSADAGAGGSTFLTGGGQLTLAGSTSVAGSSRLVIESPVTLASTGDTMIGGNATLELLGEHDAETGHATSIDTGGRLLLAGSQVTAFWSGDIISSAGVIDVQVPEGFWRHEGLLQLGSVFGLRTRIDGTAALRAYGTVAAPGLGGIVDGTLDLRTGSTLELATANSLLIVNGTTQLRSDALATGLGRVEVASGGTLLIGEGADVEVPVVNDGTLHAGSDADPVAYAYIDGSYTQEPNGRLVVQLAGSAPTERDVYETSGAATLSGTLSVELLDGYMPAPGDTFEMLYANGGLTGTFDAIDGAPGFEATYGPSIVTLVYVGEDTCPADIDGDGAVGVSDLLAVLGAWGPCGDCPADLDRSGAVDIADLLAVLAAWGTCA